MTILETRNISYRMQHLYCIGSSMAIIGLWYLVAASVNYRILAMVLLMVVSLQALLFKVFPVLVSALLSAVLLNFLFIPPRYTLHIGSSEDILLFFIYLSIVSVSAIFTHQIKFQEEKVRGRERKEETIQLYNTVLNSLSHELRTPISTIIGNLDLLKCQYNSDKKIEKGTLDEIETAAFRLNRQVENLLNMSRLESGTLRLKLDWVDVNELIFSVINKFADRKTHTIHYKEEESLPLMKLDGVLLGQALYNIISNALAYTPEFSEIWINVKYLDTSLEIAVVDNGHGIADSELETIFEKFYRVPNTRTGGNGLGLSIAKGYVEAHKGRIIAVNNEKGGASFILKIPAEVTYMNRLKNE